MGKRPIRLRLSRAKGFDLQLESRRANGREAVSVGRPGRWGNPFRITAARSAEAAVNAFHAALLAGELGFGAAEVKALLGGRNLACWCAPDAPCHADILLDIANP
jgi:Domain of unknown function (DUF4326)